MGIKQRVEYVQTKLSLTATLAKEMREVKDAVEEAGWVFSLEEEIAAALTQMRVELEKSRSRPVPTSVRDPAAS